MQIIILCRFVYGAPKVIQVYQLSQDLIFPVIVAIKSAPPLAHFARAVIQPGGKVRPNDPEVMCDQCFRLRMG